MLRSLKPEERVREVRLLGAGKLSFAQNFGIVTVQLPEKMPTKYINCLALTIA